jgi:hypothetical protein
MQPHLAFCTINHLIGSFFHQLIKFFRVPHFIADLAELLGFSHFITA